MVPLVCGCGNSPSLHREILLPNLVIFCGSHAPYGDSSFGRPAHRWCVADVGGEPPFS